MKLFKRLNIGGSDYPIIEDRAILSLSSPGRASFLVDAEKGAVGSFQAVSLDLRWDSGESAQRFFHGFVESVTAVDYKRQRVFCREFSGGLAGVLPLSLRHVSLFDVLGQVSEMSGLEFAIPDADYSRRRIANFFNLGSGYHAMDAIGRAFAVPDFIWQQQGDGVIFAGGWVDSRYFGADLALPDSFFSGQLSDVSAAVVAVPQLRPGYMLNGRRVLGVEFSGNSMVVTWTKR